MSEQAWIEELAMLRMQRSIRMYLAESKRADDWRQIRLMVWITVIAVSMANLAGLI